MVEIYHPITKQTATVSDRAAKSWAERGWKPKNDDTAKTGVSESKSSRPKANEPSQTIDKEQ